MTAHTLFVCCSSRVIFHSPILPIERTEITVLIVHPTIMVSFGKSYDRLNYKIVIRHEASQWLTTPSNAPFGGPIFLNTIVLRWRGSAQ